METPAKKIDAAEVVRELMKELNYAYQNVHTLPADHPARVAYERAASFLQRR